jgi:hypothetical protein
MMPYDWPSQKGMSPLVSMTMSHVSPVACTATWRHESRGRSTIEGKLAAAVSPQRLANPPQLSGGAYGTCRPCVGSARLHATLQPLTLLSRRLQHPADCGWIFQKCSLCAGVQPLL